MRSACRGTTSHYSDLSECASLVERRSHVCTLIAMESGTCSLPFALESREKHFRKEGLNGHFGESSYSMGSYQPLSIVFVFTIPCYEIYSYSSSPAHKPNPEKKNPKIVKP